MNSLLSFKPYNGIVTKGDFLNALGSALGPKGLTSDPDAMAPWLTDWRGRYHGAAVAMAMPAATAEVAAVLRICSDHRVPIVPQGGNTSMVGGAVPDGTGTALVLSLRRMNRVRRLDAAAGLATVEAGVILSELHDIARGEHMRFPLSLGAKGSATIGGLCSTNAGGTQVLRFGTMRSLVLGLEAVLPDGSVLDSLAPLKKDNRGPDLKQLLIGAEGTLGVITAATLHLVPEPPETATAWVGLDSPQTALSLLRRLERLPFAVESFELIPADSLELVLRHIPGTRPPLESASPWNALIEATGERDVREQLESALADALDRGLASDGVLAANQAQAMAFWRIRESISEAERASGPAVQHDISVPVSAMPDFMTSAAAEVERAFPGTSATAFGHLGDGNVHFHVRAPADVDPERWITQAAKPISDFVYDRVIAAAGSISAEHGIGQMKLDTFQRVTDPARLRALNALKAAFDPLGIMNPGKLVPSLASDARAP
ncbi:FAD-binding protein [Sphingomonas sp. MAH-20]|uniref:FAD-binding protein n=1 Tax=Sphingomonas horti TaxID=2682842 RepID=A0A6I4J3P4_9SPHN|nr:FAD-binding oxidoreductase [Sphingomonas sp. CGMCC 1.13658]MVO77941.1 FAD-binding protein [Sphingomonas horti]